MATQLVSARREPTERSIPAVMITKVIPVPMMAKMDTWRTTFVRLWTVRNSFEVKDMRTTSTASMTMEP